MPTVRWLERYQYLIALIVGQVLILLFVWHVLSTPSPGDKVAREQTQLVLTLLQENQLALVEHQKTLEKISADSENRLSEIESRYSQMFLALETSYQSSLKSIEDERQRQAKEDEAKVLSSVSADTVVDFISGYKPAPRSEFR